MGTNVQKRAVKATIIGLSMLLSMVAGVGLLVENPDKAYATLGLIYFLLAVAFCIGSCYTQKQFREKLEMSGGLLMVFIVMSVVQYVTKQMIHHDKDALSLFEYITMTTTISCLFLAMTMIGHISVVMSKEFLADARDRFKQMTMSE